MQYYQMLRVCPSLFVIDKILHSVKTVRIWSVKILMMGMALKSIGASRLRLIAPVDRPGNDVLSQLPTTTLLCWLAHARTLVVQDVFVAKSLQNFSSIVYFHISFNHGAISQGEVSISIKRCSARNQWLDAPSITSVGLDQVKPSRDASQSTFY